MSKSRRLRIEEFRSIFQIVGECRELGDYPMGWRRHLAIRLNHILDTPTAVSGEGAGTRCDSPMLIAHESQLVANDRSAYVAFLTGDGIRRSLMVSRFPSPVSGAATLEREQVLADREWHSSADYLEAFQPDGIDAGILSVHALACGAVDVLAVHPALGRRLGERERSLVEILHREIAPLIGSRLAGTVEPRIDVLSTRLRQTLDALLEGDSEKQLARRLGISRDTVHVYVKALYRHFSVVSRAELLAHFLRRHRAAIDTNAGNTTLHSG